MLKKTNLNSVKELLITTDDNLGSVFSQFNYEESFKLKDLKLGLGLIQVLIAGLLFLADRKFQFHDIFTITVISCLLYGGINAVLYIINYKFKNVKYVGLNKSDKLVIKTWSTKYDPIYNITIIKNDKETTTTQIPYNKIFDVLGLFNRDEFSKLIKLELGKLGKKNE
ncbi:unnamed protein product [Candida verbasci]|uniref:Signal peptidase complex subunit 2 n=1 Tax=Candida verbasci TaxID=1227364 RepID=A0A9W4U0D5_9ASCO|nr:unnamed protein product [Candida verbasci]